MHVRFSVVLLATALLTRAAHAAGVPAPVDAPMVWGAPVAECTLGNGLRVVVLEDHRLPVVSLRLAYATGTRADRLGLSILLPHLMQRASAHVPKGRYESLLGDAGARGTTWGLSLDETAFATTLPSNRLGLALWLWSDAMGFLGPTVDARALDEARTAAQRDRATRVDNVPYGATEEVSRAALYPAGHPYRNAPIGSAATSAGATPADVLAYQREWFGPESAVLVLVGDVRTNDALASVDRYFGTIPRGAGRRVLATPTGAAPHDTRVEVQANVPDTVVVVDWLLPPEGRPSAAWATLAAVLGGAQVRVLEWELGDSHHLVTHARAEYIPRALGPVLRASLRVSGGQKPDDVVAELDRTIAALARDGVRRLRVARAVSDLGAGARELEETTAGRAYRLAHAATRGLPAIEAADYDQRVSTLNAAELNAAVKLLPAARRVVITFTPLPTAPVSGVVLRTTSSPPP